MRVEPAPFLEAKSCRSNMNIARGIYQAYASAATLTPVASRGTVLGRHTLGWLSGAAHWAAFVVSVRRHARATPGTAVRQMTGRASGAQP
ncbi:MAG: hypothetical protein NVS3B17_11250 [Vulcanimicrobiaceae bacterium]